MGIVAPHLPEVRADGPGEDVEGVALENTSAWSPSMSILWFERMWWLSLSAWRFVLQAPTRSSAGMLPGDPPRERGEVRVDLVGEIASAPLPVFGIDGVVNLVHDARDLHLIEVVLDGDVRLLVQCPLLRFVDPLGYSYRWTRHSTQPAE